MSKPVCYLVRIFGLLLPLTLGSAPSLAAEQVPATIEAQAQAVLDADYTAILEAYSDEPEDPESLPPRTYTNAYMFTPIDLNGDGVSDWRVNFYRTTNGFCGTGGCLNQIYVSRPDGEHDLVFDRQVLQMQIVPATQDASGLIVLDLHGNYCSGSGAMECPVAYRWNDQARALLAESLPQTASRAPVLSWINGSGPRQLPDQISESFSRFDEICNTDGLGAANVPVERIPDLDGDGRADWVVGSSANCAGDLPQGPFPISIWLDRDGGPIKSLEWTQGSLLLDVSEPLPVIVGQGLDECYVGLDAACSSKSFRWSAEQQEFVAADDRAPPAAELALLESHEAMLDAGLVGSVSEEDLSAAHAQTRTLLESHAPTDLFLARARLVEGQFLLVRGDPRAEELLRRARESFSLAGAGLKPQYALASLYLARAISSPARLDERADAARIAIGLLGETGQTNSWQAKRAYELYLDALFRQNNLQVDEQEFSRIIALGAGAGPDSWVTAHRLIYYSGALARKEMRWQDALAIDEQTLAESLSVPGVDIATLAEERGRVALDLLNLARFEEAAAMSQSALEQLAQRYGEDDLRTLQAASAAGEILNRAGRLVEAETLLRKTTSSLSLLQGAGYELPLALRRLGETALVLGRLSEARALLQQAFVSEEDLLAREIFGEGYDDLASARALGRVFYLSGDRQAARELFARTLEITDFNDPVRPERLAFLLDYLEIAPPARTDDLFVLATMLDAAEPTLIAIADQAVSIASQILPEGHPEIVRALRIAARARSAAHDENALSAANDALSASALLPGDGVTTGLEVRTDMINLLLDQPEVNLEQATALASQALAIARDRRSRLQSEAGAALDPELKRGFLAPALVANAFQEAGQDIPGELMEMAFQGLQDAEVSQAGIATARAYLARTAAGTAAAQLLEDFTAANERARSLDRLYVTALARGDVAGSAQLQMQADQAQAAADAADLQLRQTLPAYSSLAEQRALSIEEAYEHLPDGTTLLLFSNDDRDIAIFALTGETYLVQVIRGYSAEFDEEISRLRCTIEPDRCPSNMSGALDEALANANWTLDDVRTPFDLLAAERIYQNVFAAVFEFVPPYDQLMLVQQGSTSRLPLAILPTNAPETADPFDPGAMSDVVWLSDLHSIEQLPSVATLGLNIGGPAQASSDQQSFIGYGNPAFAGNKADVREIGLVFAGGADATVRMANPGRLANLAPLPGTQRELEAMALVLGADEGTVVTGSLASESALKGDLRLAGAQVVAFATHGLLPNELQGISEPGLVFSPPNNASEFDDGMLAASEVADLHFAARLVILSACNSASTSGEPGADSLSSLARAFLLAGAQSVMATRWSVPDDPTAALTVEALRSFDAGSATRSEALRLAMVAIRTGQRSDGTPVPGWQTGWSHPQAWGGFVQIGSGK